jgi:hypothetical protein
LRLDYARHDLVAFFQAVQNFCINTISDSGADLDRFQFGPALLAGQGINVSRTCALRLRTRRSGRTARAAPRVAATTTATAALAAAGSLFPFAAAGARGILR